MSTDLPPDLAAFERELSGRDPQELPAGLRPRVLAAVGRELRPRPRLPAWQFAAATAAAALLWVNLSMSVANNLSWRLDRGGLDPRRLEETAGRIRALAPELPEREVYRQALLAQPGVRPAPGPAAPSSPERVLKQRERQEWDTH